MSVKSDRSGGPLNLEHSKTLARLAAVQALFQMEAANVGVQRGIDDFVSHWMRETISMDEVDGADLSGADKSYFTKLLTGVVEAQDRIDPYLERQLAEGWKLNRIDPTARAILRLGLYELIRIPDTPAKVVIDQYISIAHAFFDDQEPAFINGVLDAAARAARSDELSL